MAAWFGAMASAAVSAAIALQFVIRVVIAGWPRLSEAVCRSVVGRACTPMVYRSALFELGLGIVATVGRWRCSIQRSSTPCSRTSERTWPAGTTGW
jgi:hypothetical protein